MSHISLITWAQKPALFTAPPRDARPKVFWQWPGGLISKDGIRKDLEAMAQQGIGGVMIMQMPDQEPYPQVWAYRNYPNKVKVLSDNWFDMVNYAISEADRLGLTVEMFMCPGWNYAAAPEVTAEKSLKVLSVSKLIVNGDKEQQIILPKPQVGSVNWNTPAWHKDYNRRNEFKKYYNKDIAVLAFPRLENNQAIDPKTIINLTSQLRPDGTVTWKAPKGNWEIWRIALVTANFLNHPAPIESLGEEADRMDVNAVKIVYNAIVGRINKEARAKGYHSFKGFETDSYESGYQDFSLDFEKEFKTRNGYDCVPWLPAWKGNLIIGNAQLTERFKYDMKCTISALWQERFFKSLQDIAKSNHLIWKLEPYFTVDLDWRSISQLAQSGSEFWVKDSRVLDGTAPETAVLYGQKKVWAEAFTAEPYASAWRNDPQVLKPVADFAYTMGINELIMHGFPLNSFGDKYQPGFSMGYWGTNMGRFVTWWPYSKAWHTYLSRCDYMLQQGIPAADALVYPNDMDSFPHMINSAYRLVMLTDDVLFNNLYVQDGKLRLPNGQTFQALILRKNVPLTPKALKKIRELLNAGATLIGDAPPAYSASLNNYPDCDTQISSLIKSIWAASSQSGRIISGLSVDEALSKVIGEPDVFGGEFLAGHRRLSDGDLFFLSNQKNQKISADVSFKVTGLTPAWWDPMSGTVMLIKDYQEKNGRTVIPITLSKNGSGFVVFNKTHYKNLMNKSWEVRESVHQTLDGPWSVSFNPKWGGPANTKFERLKDWSLNVDSGIRYYSGTAVYTKIFDANDINANVLDLGEVKNIAEVSVNGKLLGIIWCAPWQISIPKNILKASGNILKIKVANTWVNRLIGDEQEPEDCDLVTVNTTGGRTGGYKIGVIGKALKDLPDWLINGTPRPSSNRKTFTSWRYYDKEAPLESSGLLGPVTLKTSE